jgi:hypothetical protein
MKLVHCLLAAVGIIAFSFAYAQGAETDVKSSWDKAIIYCLLRGLGEKPSPLGEDFSMPSAESESLFI